MMAVGWVSDEGGDVSLEIMAKRLERTKDGETRRMGEGRGQGGRPYLKLMRLGTRVELL
jgi:hypothetical protein